MRRSVANTSTTSQPDHLRSGVCNGLGDGGESGLGDGGNNNGNGVVVGIQGVSEPTAEDRATMEECTREREMTRKKMGRERENFRVYLH